MNSPRRGARWLNEGVAALERCGSGPIRWFRPPFGAVSPQLYAAARGAGLEVAWCSSRTGDGVSIAANALRERLAGAGPGDIVLIHDGRALTLEVLPDVLRAWSVPVGTLGSLA